MSRSASELDHFEFFCLHAREAFGRYLIVREQCLPCNSSADSFWMVVFTEDYITEALFQYSGFEVEYITTYVCTFACCKLQNGSVFLQYNDAAIISHFATIQISTIFDRPFDNSEYTPHFLDLQWEKATLKYFFNYQQLNWKVAWAVSPRLRTCWLNHLLMNNLI